ncbi:MAG: penicillin-binding protein 2 [Acidimicrobiales bacterium]
MSRSLRHPFKGSHRYLRQEKDRNPRRKRTKQPKMRQSRFSVESILDAPDTSSSRPGLRLRVTGLVVVGLFALLGLRLWALTVLQGPAAAQAVSVDQIRSVQIDPTRGLILDRYGNPLVSNQVVEQITLSRVAAQQDPEVVGRLAALIGETPQQVRASIADTRYSLYKPVPVLTGAPLADILYISEHQSDFPGVASVQTTERKYPQVELPGPASMGYPASQVLGYVGTINGSELASRASQGYQAGDAFGQSGLEYQYESELRGAPGRQELEVTPEGQVAGTVSTTPAVAGDNVVTNIDTNLQQVADNALATQITQLRRTRDPLCNNHTGCYPAATGGAVVVMDPQTGAVYAMSSYPTYNPSIWVGGITSAQYAGLSNQSSNEPLLNRAIDGLYTPGSTFKLNTATAALDLGLITPSYSYYDDGTFKVPGCQYNSTSCILHNNDGDATGAFNVSTALTVSSDDFFYNLGAMFYDDRGNPAFGATPIQDQANQYGLGELTGIDLPGEAQGRVDSQTERDKLHAEAPVAFPNTTWYTGDNVEMAFGQGATVITPIEQAVAYSTFANGGTRYAPQVAAAIVSPTGKVVKKVSPQVTGHVNLPPVNQQAMLSGFEGAVNSKEGTAYGVPGLASFPGGLAGKTGTADTEIGKEPTAWFVGWGPTASAAQYLVVCVIDQAGYGASAAAPVVGQIFSYLAAHPVTPAAIPPGQSVYQSTVPLTPPSLATTTTTASTGSSTTATSTATPNG